MKICVDNRICITQNTFTEIKCKIILQKTKFSLETQSFIEQTFFNKILFPNIPYINITFLQTFLSQTNQYILKFIIILTRAVTFCPSKSGHEYLSLTSPNFLTLFKCSLISMLLKKFYIFKTATINQNITF